MNYISTKELAEKWGISKSRLLYLVKDGRIPEAKQIGKAWVFPENTKKPQDNRCKHNENRIGNTAFHFPLYFYQNYKKEEIELDFTEDERILYSAEQNYYQELYSESAEIIKKLLSRSIDPTIQAGALYFYCRNCIMLRQKSGFFSAYEDLKKLLSNEIPYKKELVYVLYDLESYFKGNQYFLKQFRIDEDYRYHETTRNYIFVLSAFSNVLKLPDSQKSVDLLMYELICQGMEDDECYFSSMSLHNFIGLTYLMTGKIEKGSQHLRKGLKQALEHGYLQEMSYLYHYTKSVYDSLLSEEEFIAAACMPNKCNYFLDSLHNFVHGIGSSISISGLNHQDMEYLRFAVQGLSIKEISGLMGLSVSTISKRYCVIYELTGTKNRKELVELANTYLKEYKSIQQLED